MVIFNDPTTCDDNTTTSKGNEIQVKVPSQMDLCLVTTEKLSQRRRSKKSLRGHDGFRSLYFYFYFFQIFFFSRTGKRVVVIILMASGGSTLNE
jgi:hypothetical protein